MTNEERTRREIEYVQKRNRNQLIWIFSGAAVLLLLVVILDPPASRTREVGGDRTGRQPLNTEAAITLTIDGYDEDSKAIIQRINLWNNYETRARIVGQVRHGEKVTLIRRDGDGVLVETESGVQGWLTYWFIQEYGK